MLFLMFFFQWCCCYDGYFVPTYSTTKFITPNYKIKYQQKLNEILCFLKLNTGKEWFSMKIISFQGTIICKWVNSRISIYGVNPLKYPFLSQFFTEKIKDNRDIPLQESIENLKKIHLNGILLTHSHEVAIFQNIHLLSNNL